MFTNLARPWQSDTVNTLGRMATVGVIATLAGFTAAYAYRQGDLDLGHLGEPRDAVDVDGALVSLPRPKQTPRGLLPSS